MKIQDIIGVTGLLWMAVILTAMVFRPLWILVVVASIAVVVAGVLIAINYNNVSHYIMRPISYIYIMGGISSTGLAFMLSSVPLLESMGLWIFGIGSLTGIYSLHAYALLRWITVIKSKLKKQNKSKLKKQKS